MSLYKEQFSIDYDFKPYYGDVKNIVFCTTPRCGSHMLGHMLYQSKAFGFPLEYLNELNLKKWKSIVGSQDLREVIDGLKVKRTSENGVFSIKTHFSHMKNCGGMGVFKSLFPNAKYIHIKRRDVVGQAVSFFIAKKTEKWISYQNAVIDQSDVEYDFNEVDKCLKALLNHNSWWEYALLSTGVDYITINYEDLIIDPMREIKKIAEFSEVDMSGDFNINPLTDKQSTSISEVFKQRYLRDVDSKISKTIVEY